MNSVTTETASLSLQDKRKLLTQFLKSGPSEESSNLSLEQRRLCLLRRLGPTAPRNVRGKFEVKGVIDIGAFERSLAAIVARHDILRSKFVDLEGRPLRIGLQMPQVEVVRLDLQKSRQQEQQREVDRLLATRLKEPMDVANGLPFRTFLVQTGPEMHLLLLSIDELAGDAKSLDLLARQAVEHYNNDRSESEPVPLRYGDFILKERAWLESNEFDNDLAYWRQKLAEAPPLQLPLDHPRPSIKTHHASTQTVAIPSEVVEKLEALAQSEDVSLEVTVLAVFELLLARYSGEEDILVGVQTDIRSAFGFPDRIGQFSNPVVVRTEVRRSLSFSQLLARSKNTFRRAEAHGKMPFEKLLECLQPERDLSRSPLFQVMYIWDEDELSEKQAGPLELRKMDVTLPEGKYDLTLSVSRTHEGMRARLEHNLDLFDSETAERMLGHLQNLLASVLRQPQEPVFRLELLAPAERRQIVDGFNWSEADFPADKCIHQLFEVQAAKTPKAIAVVFEGQQLTYENLNITANQLAHRMQALGVKAESRVAICLERSLDLVIAILATLKAGGCYVPIDPSYPEDRVRHIAADTKPEVLLTHYRLREKFPDKSSLRVICLDSDIQQIRKTSEANPELAITPENLAYVIYTSGSTGVPKGTMVTHRGVVNNLWWRQTSWPLTHEDKVMHQTSFSFDPSVWSTFWPLIAGAQLVLVPDDECADPLALAQIITRRGITVYTAVPSLNAVLLQSPGISFGNKLRHIFSGGERLTADLRQLVGATQTASFYNVYGPTEATIDAAFWVCPSSGELESTPIGRPLPNVQIYILDDDLQPLPVGVNGEIYIGGVGLSRGYQNMPHLTAERFVADPFSREPGTRLYRSGDIGRFRKDGNVEFSGRRDEQVKVRGVRIELEEIDAVIRSHPYVRDCAAAVFENPGTGASIAAYVVTSESLSSKDLTEYLSRTLPNQLLPQSFIFLSDLPRLPSGKLDRKSLPSPELQESEREFREPETELEKEIAEAFADVLGLDKVSVDDNFFDIGGNSLLIALLAARLSTTYEMDLPLPEIFDKATIRGVARVVETFQKEGIKGVIRMRTTSQLDTEATLDPTITAEGLPFANLLDPRNVLLTGATGYLGAFLLERLLRVTRANVYCLVRASGTDSVPMWFFADSEESEKLAEGGHQATASEGEREGLRRIKETLQLYKIWDDDFQSRIRPVVGDLAKPLLGLTPERFNDLAGRIDAIYHSGAFVNFLYPYEGLKPANVLGTQEVLRFATTKQLKAMHHISTVDVLLGTHIPRPFMEDETPLTRPIDAPDGYPRSKWVAEKIVNIGRQRGIPTCIFRPGLVMSHAQTGATQTNDYLLVNLKGYIQLGIMPEEFHAIQVVPVDYVASAIVHISRQRESFGKFFHLWCTKPILMSTAHDWVQSFGYSLKVAPFKIVRDVVVNVDQSNPLYPFVPFYRREPEERVLPAAHDPKLLQHLDLNLELQNTVNALKGSGIECPPMSEQLAHRCLEYLIDVGYLKPPVQIRPEFAAVN